MIDIFLRAWEHPNRILILFYTHTYSNDCVVPHFGPRHRGRWEISPLLFCGNACWSTYSFVPILLGARFDLIFFLFLSQAILILPFVYRLIVCCFQVFWFFSVGFLEEYAKHWVVKKVDHNVFESIDDVIEFFYYWRAWFCLSRKCWIFLSPHGSRGYG